MSGPPAEPASVSPVSRRHAGRSSLTPRHLVSRGGRRAALFLAREARRSLHRDPLARLPNGVRKRPTPVRDA